ncbi:MAG TPA: GNAT family N-acetyltransferase [Symbiobacteriaceae bacterium]|nr:GNAT family N-acetyltransferase [Symbiobacteriaceae bacterium]
MPVYLVTGLLARRIEASDAAHWASRMTFLAARPGNPYGAEVRRFGHLVALACPGMKGRSVVNRIIGAGDGDEANLANAVAWLRSLGVPVRIDVTPLHGHENFLRTLAHEGFCVQGFQAALYGKPDLLSSHTPPPVEVRHAETEAELAFCTKALAKVFAESDPAWALWLQGSMVETFGRPDWQTYVASVDGELAGFGQLYIENGVGCLALCGTMPKFRGLGVQTALIRRRVGDAAAAGCELITAQAGDGSVSGQNIERAGLRVAYTKAEFYEWSPGKSPA